MKYLVIFFLFLFLIPILTHAQEKKEQKVGLVLSGGGAKGLAHIGALKVIEEAGIKLDYIGGTSMGAVVGALYASGYTANQLDSLFQEVNFNILLQDEIPRSAKTFHEKEDAERYALSLPFDNFNISFPSGLSKGQNIYNLINRLTVHLGNVRDFSELPIPFFCVASNIETGEQVILESGSLAKAVSASAAIPSLFTPVRVDGKLLTDGGVTNNYPVEELRERGAELIIGVDVQDTLLDRDELSSAFQILTQIGNFRTIREMGEKVDKTDIYIKPDVSGFSILSFERGQKIINSGEEAARNKLTQLKKVASQQSSSREIKKVEPVDTIAINAVIIEGNSSYPRSYILGKLKLRYNSQYTIRELNRGINNLTATANFDRINYSLTPNNGSYDLALQLEESRNKTSLKMALHYDDLYKSAALVNITRKSLLVTNDAASLDIILGDNSRYNFNYFLDKGYRWSFGLKSRYNHFNKDVSINSININPMLEDLQINKIDLDYQDYTHQLYAETFFKQVFSLGLGVEHKFLKIISETIGSTEQNIALPSTIFEKSHFYSTFGYLKLDSYDNKYFPSKGVYFNGNFQLYLFSSDYNQNFSEYSIARGAIGYAFSPLNNFSMRISSETGFRIGSDGNHSLDFFLGGYGNNLINNLIPFYGYDFLGISSDSYIKALFELDYEIFRKNHIIASANFANLENDLYSSGNWLSTPDYSGYALGYGLETFLGPMEVKYSYSPEIKNSEWYFSLGFWF